MSTLDMGILNKRLSREERALIAAYRATVYGGDHEANLAGIKAEDPLERHRLQVWYWAGREAVAYFEDKRCKCQHHRCKNVRDFLSVSCCCRCFANEDGVPECQVKEGGRS